MGISLKSGYFLKFSETKIKYFLSLEDLQIGEEVATCPSCSLLIRVIYDEDQFADYESDEEVANVASAIAAM